MGKDGAGPNPTRWRLLRDRDLLAVPMTDPGYVATINYFLPMTRNLIENMMAKDKLGTFIYPAGGAGHGARGHRHRQSVGVPRPDRAGGMIDVPDGKPAAAK